MLVIEGLTHKQYRTWLAQNDLPLYHPSPGLQQELVMSDATRSNLAETYHLTTLELNNCLYGTKKSHNTSLKRERAAQLHNAGGTQLQVLNENLPPNIAVLSEEITARRADGDSVAYLAELYGYHPSRISQLDTGAKHKGRLTKEDKSSIQQSQKPVKELAKQYNVTLNTIYVVRREKQCRNI